MPSVKSFLQTCQGVLLNILIKNDYEKSLNFTCGNFLAEKLVGRLNASQKRRNILNVY